MRHHKGLVAAAACTSLGMSAFWVIEPLYARTAIDRLLLITQGQQVDPLRIFGIWGLIFLGMNIVSGFNMYARWSVYNRLLARLRESYYRHLLTLDIRHHVQSKTGELMKTLDNACDAAVDLTRQVLLELPTSFLTATFFYVLSFMISWKLALIAVLMVPVYVAIVWTTVRWTRKNVQKVNALWVKSLGRGYDAMANIFTVKSSAAEERELESMAQIHREGLAELDKVNRFWAALEGFGYFGMLRLVMIGTGIWLLVRGEISLGSLFFFQFSFFRLVVPFEMLSSMMPRWNELVGKIRLAEEIYGKEVEIESKAGAVTLPDFRGEIALDDVSFSYGDADALRELTLTIRPGEHIALVGHSGAGKSTIAMLLNRFYDPTGGRITVDGTDMTDLDVQWWRARIGLVLQENITFNDTIGNNIRYSRPDATDAEVEDAARRAAAHEFISRLPKGYGTMVGERGIRLSGGERQRVAIARAILKKPSIVILDEATSALDSLTEREVQEGIRSLIEGRTAVIIAHRLSTVRSVDRIAVLEGGRLIACAPHDELLKTCELYRRMVELQHGGILADEAKKQADTAPEDQNS